MTAYWGCCGKMKPEHRPECQYYNQLPPAPDYMATPLEEPVNPYMANARQVGGEHYKNPIQHWDWVASNDLDYFQGQITKYVARWKLKNGVEDLNKALHFLEKYIELSTTEQR